MKEIKNWTFKILIVILFLSSCSVMDRLPGEYQNKDKSAILVLNKDGTFRYSEEDSEDGCGMLWSGSKAHGTWVTKKNNIIFSIDSTLKPKIKYLDTEKETIKITFKDSLGNEIRSRTTVGVNMNNTITNRLDDHFLRKNNNIETINYQKVDKIMVYLLGSETNLFLETKRRPQNIEVLNFCDYIYYELEEAEFKISRNKIKGTFLQEYSNHGKRKINKKKIKFKKSQ